MWNKKKLSIILILFVGSWLLLYSEGDANITYTNLKFLRSINLEENDSVIITHITNVSINSSSSKILISDADGRILILYNAEDGKVIRTFEAGLNYSDSLAIKGKYWNDEYKYVRTDQIRDTSGKPLPYEYLRRRLDNEMIEGIFYDDNEIWATAHIKCYAVPKDTNKKDDGIRVGLATGIIRFNLKEGTSTYTPLEQIQPAFPSPYSFAVDKIGKNILILSKNFTAFKNELFDSLWIISAYSYEGKRLNLVAKMPEEYTITKIGYRMLYEPKFCFNSSNELLCIFPYSERIFNISKGVTFKLQSLPHSNKPYLDSLALNPNLFDDFIKRYFYFLPITIHNIYTKLNDDIIITLMHVYKYSDTNIVRERIIQEYSKNGNLLRQFKFNYRDDDRYINYIYYDKYKDEYLIFKKSNTKGWSIDFYKYED